MMRHSRSNSAKKAPPTPQLGLPSGAGGGGGQVPWGTYRLRLMGLHRTASGEQSEGLLLARGLVSGVTFGPQVAKLSDRGSRSAPRASSSMLFYADFGRFPGWQGHSGIQHQRPPLYFLTNVMVAPTHPALRGGGGSAQRDLFGTARTKEGAPQGT